MTKEDEQRLSTLVALVLSGVPFDYAAGLSKADAEMLLAAITVVPASKKAN